MSLTNLSTDSTSRPARSRIDELVPSRYALKIGEIDMMVISDGVLPLPTKMLDITPTRPSGRPGLRTCSCRRTPSTGR